MQSSSTPRVLATTDDVTAPTLICISDAWLRAIGVPVGDVEDFPLQIGSPSGGVISTPFSHWDGNSQCDVRSLAAMPADRRRLVLVGVSEGDGGPGSLGPVTLLGLDRHHGLVTDGLVVQAVLAELDRPRLHSTIASDRMAEQVRAACCAYLARLGVAQEVSTSRDDVTVPTLICISNAWLRAIGVPVEDLENFDSEIDSPNGGVITTPLTSWGGEGNGQCDVRSLAAMPADRRRLVLVGVSEGDGAPGSLGHVTLMGLDRHDGIVANEHVIKAVIAELGKLPASMMSPTVFAVRDACRHAYFRFLGVPAQASQPADANDRIRAPASGLTSYTIRLVRPDGTQSAAATCACARLADVHVATDAFSGLVVALAQAAGGVTGRYDLYEGEGRPTDQVGSYHVQDGKLTSFWAMGRVS